MTTYAVAVDNGRTGHAKTLRAEINIGLKKGYDGFLQEKAEVIVFLKDLYRKAVTAGRNYIPVGIQKTEIVYAYPTDGDAFADAEPALTLFSDKSPLYAADMSEEQWKVAVEELASALADRFQQYRVYVTYIAVEVRILQQVK